MPFKYGKYALLGIAALVLVFLLQHPNGPSETSKQNALLSESEFHLDLDMQKQTGSNIILNAFKNEITYTNHNAYDPIKPNSFSLPMGTSVGLNFMNDWPNSYQHWSHRYAQYQVSFDRKDKPVDDDFLKNVQSELSSQIEVINRSWQNEIRLSGKGPNRLVQVQGVVFSKNEIKILVHEFVTDELEVPFYGGFLPDRSIVDQISMNTPKTVSHNNLDYGTLTFSEDVVIKKALVSYDHTNKFSEEGAAETIADEFKN